MGFFKNNQVLLVMIPLIVGSHFAWGALQNDKRFVSEEEKKGQPLFEIAEKTWNYLKKKGNDSSN
ncbi:hypothetical protein HA402_003579 [Bradysia odoriphaga]|nr:hypothetical protein HA402_003579 [Bradysia odoriphaga]